MEKETLEEAAKNWITKNSGIKSLLTPEFVRESFIAGAKWQAEKMYSEEEVKFLLSKFRENLVNCIGHKGLIGSEKWFEQFKKK